MLSRLEGAVERSVAKLKRGPKSKRPEPMVVLVEGQECVKVPLTKGMWAIVDKADAEMVSGFNWYAFRHTHGFYAARKLNHGSITLFMHNVLLPPTNGLQTDHRNGDGCDNRRCNLRVATISQNHANSKKQVRKTSSAHKGVHWLKRERRWRAKIQVNYKEILLGYFRSEEDAALAYRQASERFYGEFAVHNRQHFRAPTKPLEQRKEQCTYRNSNNPSS